MKKILPLLIILFFSVKALPVLAQAINAQDSLALVQLYDSTNGPGWQTKTNWNTAAPVGTWYGVLTTGDRVTTLILSQNKLIGKLPISFGNLTGLTDVDFFSNTLSGTIPSSIGNLTSLTQLSLQANKLSGAIPSSIGNLTLLTQLDLADNKLTGSIPASIGNLTQLENLFLSVNKFTGEIPVFISTLVNLKILDLSSDGFTGTIPPELGNLTKLTSLALNGNRLGGVIPPELGNLKNLKTLYLSSNMLTGTLPITLAGLPITQFRVMRNLLSDTIPDGFIKHHYQLFGIDNNQFTFESLEKIDFSQLDQPSIKTQKQLHINKNGNILSVSAGGTLSANTYKWYRNGILFSTIKADSTFTVASIGLYSVTVYNSIVSHNSSLQIFLQSDTVTVLTLPLQLLQFTGAASKNTVELKWQTSGEINTKSFEIQRQGLQGNFIKAGVVNANNLPGSNNYNFTDEQPLQGTNYYRLKMIDKDGRFSFSRIVSVKMGGDNGLQVYPNPVTNALTLAFNSPLTGGYTIEVVSINGKLLKRLNITAVQGENKVKLYISNYSPGDYIISLTNKETGKKQNLQVIKSR